MSRARRGAIITGPIGASLYTRHVGSDQVESHSASTIRHQQCVDSQRISVIKYFVCGTTKERAMHNGQKRIMSTRQPRTAMSFAVRSKPGTSRAVRLEPEHSQNAQRNYERYLALARVEDLIGNTVGAENYYQHAEHYFRLMTSRPDELMRWRVP